MASDNQAELKAVKEEILGLVMSNPNRMDMNGLIRDFRDTIGASIPVSKFGYKSILTFIREECTDILRLSGDSYNPTLTPFVPAELKHVNDLIYKQKSTKTRNAPRRGPGVLHPNNFAPTNSNFESPKRDVKPLMSTQVNKPCDTNNIDFKNKKPETAVINNKSKYSPKNNRSNSTVTNNRSSPAVTNNRSSPAVTNNRSSPALTNNRSSPAMKNYRSGPNVMNNRSTPSMNTMDYKNVDNKPSCSSSVSSSSSGSTTVQQQLDKKPCEAVLSKNRRLTPRLIENLKALMNEYPEGMWCRELLSAYRKKYSIELQLEGLGYTRTESLCKDLPTVFKITRPNKQGYGEARLFSPEIDVPLQYRDGAADVQPKCSKNKNSKLETNIDDIVFGNLALPGVKTDISLYPEDCACFGEAIHSPLSLPKTFELMITEVRNPSNFWFHVISKSASKALSCIMDEMTIFYKDPKARKYRMIRAAARAGQLCAVPYESRFHRAVVVKNISLEVVRVMYIDYGTVKDVNFSDVYMLLRRFCDLAIQGHRGRLGGVLPMSRDYWSQTETDKFIEVIRECYLQGDVLSRCEKENSVTLRLTDQYEEMDIATLLLSEGFATVDDGSVKSHLLSFDKLEQGDDCAAVYLPEASVCVSQDISEVKSFENIHISDNTAMKKEILGDVFKPVENISVNKPVEYMKKDFTSQMEPNQYQIPPQLMMPSQYQQNLSRPPRGTVVHPEPNLGHYYPHAQPQPCYPYPPNYGNNIYYPVASNQLYNTQWPVHRSPLPVFSPPLHHPNNSLNVGPVAAQNHHIRTKRPSSVCSSRSVSSDEVSKITNISIDKINNMRNNIDRDIQNKNLDKPINWICDKDTLNSSLAGDDCLEIVSSDEFDDDEKPHVSINIDEYQMTLSIVTEAFGEVLEIWDVKCTLYVILQQSVKVFIKEEIDFMKGFSEKNNTVPICTLLQDEEYIAQDLSRKIKESGISGLLEGESLTIINKKSIDFNKPYVVLVPLERLLEVLCFEPDCNMKYDLQTTMMCVYELYRKYITSESDVSLDSDSD